MNKEFIPYEQALELKELEFDEPCLAYLIGFGDGTKENGRYKINQQQMFYPNDTSPDDKAEELGLHPFVMCRVPLYQQAFRWFREKYELSSWVYNSHMDKYFYTILQDGRIVKATGSETTYEEAELACLKKLIEIVKEKQ